MEIKMIIHAGIILYVLTFSRCERHIHHQLEEDINMISDRIYAVPRTSTLTMQYVTKRPYDQGTKTPKHGEHSFSTVDKKVSIYCGSFKTCETCVKSEFYACGWCHKFGCTYTPNTLCPRAKKAAFPRTKRPSNETCPMIFIRKPLVAHVGIVSVIVNVQIVDPAVLEENLQCQIIVPRNPIPLQVPARLGNDEVRCDPFDSSLMPGMQGNMNVLWGGVAPKSNYVPINLYDCGNIGSNYWQCKTVPPAYGCVWCGATQRCVYTGRCIDTRTQHRSFY